MAAPAPNIPQGENPTEDYNPFEARQLKHPTSDFASVVHLLKGSLGSGMLAMPLAFYHAGLGTGFVLTLAIGLICTYCVHILVKCAHKLCYRTRRSSLSFSEVARVAFETGPEPLRKWSAIASGTIETFLVVDLLGACSVYIQLVAVNLKKIVDYNASVDWDVRGYMAMLLVPFALLSLIRRLKYLTPFSMLANLLIFLGLTITFYYIFFDDGGLSHINQVPNFGEWANLPRFFGTVIFALEGIGVVMSLENNMEKPTHFIGCPGVLCVSMSVVVTLYATMGFFGFWKYGDKIADTITLNLPTEEWLAQSVMTMISVAIFFTYAIQFYVPMEIIWKKVEPRFPDRPLLAEYITRLTLVAITMFFAIVVLKLGAFLSLIGAVCLSSLGLMFPSIIEIVTDWDVPHDTVAFKWLVVKNVLIITFGVLGFVTGSYTAIEDIIKAYQSP